MMQCLLNGDMEDILFCTFSHSPLAVKMPETAEAVSATLTTNRNCTIEITNLSSSYCLINPK